MQLFGEFFIHRVGNVLTVLLWFLFFTLIQECTLLAPLLRNVHLRKDIRIIGRLLQNILSNGYKSKVNEVERDLKKGRIFDKFF
jgi:hypothetical protein